jgi:hypothetical protein
MSNAVPCAGVQKTVFRPPVTVTPRLKPFSFVAICPWSWYIESTPSNSSPKALMNTVSEGYGPLQLMPRAAAFSTAGLMISISSRPKRPFSPQCGFNAATAMRGFAKPAPRIVAFASVSASSMRCGVICSIASRSDTWEVTRDIHLLSSTFISPKKPLCPVRYANIWCSSLYFQPPARRGGALSGAKTMPSMRFCSAISPDRERLAA